MFLGFQVYKNSMRLLGFVFVLFIACLWISSIDINDSFLCSRRINMIKKVQNIFLIIILSISVLGSAAAFYYEYKYQFSSGKNVAEYIKENFREEEILIIGYKDYAAETIAGYLDKEIYYPESGKFQKLVKWDKR